MSMPKNPSDDSNQFPGPPAKSNNAAIVVVAIAVIGGTLLLICGGIIFGLVMTVRQQGEFIGVGFQPDRAVQQWDSSPTQAYLQEFSGFVANGQYPDAIVSIDEALQFDPDNAYLHNNKAWLLATCPDDDVRDGELAVEHATRACELTNWGNFAYVDTIAAAYAESSDFESAVTWQEKAIQLASESATPDFRQRLRLYESEKPYREGVPPSKETTAEPAAEEAAVEVEAPETTDDSEPTSEPADPTTNDETSNDDRTTTQR